MEMDSEKTCRICGDDGLYNIFNSDMEFNKRSTKIYIILNNFMYDKLYGPDEFSSMICAICCDNLFNSYSFMTQVRDSERILKTDGRLPSPTKKKLKLDLSNEEVTLRQNNEDINTENVFEDDIIEEYEDENPEPQSQTVNQISEIDASETLPLPSPIMHPEKTEINNIEEPRPLLLHQVLKNEVTKRQKLNEQISAPINRTVSSIFITDYKLVAKNESKSNVTIEFHSKLLNNSAKDDYSFSEYYELIDHKGQGSSQIYSCSYCVKAFSTCELLIKHVSSCHICLFCFEIFHKGYKDLGQHMKIHADEKFQCPVCHKQLSQQLFRQHIKKNHFPNIPFFVAVKPEK